MKFTTTTTTTALAVFLTIASSGTTTFGVVDASNGKKQRLLRGSVEEDPSSSFYRKDYDGVDYNGGDYDQEDEFSWYQNNNRQRQADRRNGRSNPAADRMNGRPLNPAADARNGVGNKRADRTNGRGIGICWACNGVPRTQYCACSDGHNNNGRTMADRWVRNRKHGRPYANYWNHGVGNKQEDGTAVA